MSAWQPVIAGAKRSLVALGVVVVVCVVAVVALQRWADALKAEVTQLQATVQEQRGQLSTKEVDLRNVRSHIKRFDALRVQGLVGSPDRPLWVEDLQASHDRVGLTSVLSYQLQVPKSVASSISGAAEPVAGSAEGTSDEPLYHDLQFVARDTHEEEVLKFIDDYRQRVVGRFRVNSCSFADPKDTGLTAQCVLRFVTIPAPKQAAAQ